MTVLRRQRRRYADRAILFHEAPVGELAPWDLPDSDVVYAVDQVPSVTDLGAAAYRALPDGWSHGTHYLKAPFPVLRYRRPDGRMVEVHRAAAYLGEGPYTARVAGEAWRTLGALVAGAFDEGRLLTTPGATGRYLLLRSIPVGVEWPVLSDETQDWLRATGGMEKAHQARSQLFGRVGERAGVWEYDARLAYADLCRELPAGEPIRDHVPDFAGWNRPGRYRVGFQVPADWDQRHDGIGLLPVWDGSRWRWPADPGEKAVTWCDARELSYALTHGWSIAIQERALYPLRAAGAPKGPLDRWAASLARIRYRVPAGQMGELVANALRSILLFGIGALHGSARDLTHVATGDEARAGLIPTTAKDVVTDGETFVWTDTEAARFAEMRHPEWTTTVWARARCRLLDAPTGVPGVRAGALHVDARHVLMAQTDALWLGIDPDWPDDGKVGRYRQVLHVPGPVRLPATANGYRALRGAS